MAELPNTYVYNGNFRRKTLTVNYKDSSGNSIPPYPKVYKIMEEFTDPASGKYYAPILTDNDFAAVSQTAYLQRLEAFYRYVESDNSGLSSAQHVVSGYAPYGASAACAAGTPAHGPDNPVD